MKRRGQRRRLRRRPLCLSTASTGGYEEGALMVSTWGVYKHLQRRAGDARLRGAPRDRARPGRRRPHSGVCWPAPGVGSIRRMWEDSTAGGRCLGSATMATCGHPRCDHKMSAVRGRDKSRLATLGKAKLEVSRPSVLSGHTVTLPEGCQRAANLSRRQHSSVNCRSYLSCAASVPRRKRDA